MDFGLDNCTNSQVERKIERRRTMAMEKAVAFVDEERGGALAKAVRPMLTEAAIQTITYDLQMAERLVTEALEEAVDYGQIPGV